jgi:hypothetical protein
MDGIELTSWRNFLPSNGKQNTFENEVYFAIEIERSLEEKSLQWELWRVP